MERRTKIVATLGPATANKDSISALIQKGVDIFRINFSHGTNSDHEDLFNMVRSESLRLKQEVAILADMQGPKIRISTFKDGKVSLVKGSKFILDPDIPEKVGDETAVGLDYKNLHKDVSINDIIIIGDGELRLQVREILERKVICLVLVSYEISNNKGINIKGGGISADAITPKDIKDMEHAVSLGADYIAFSFVRTAAELKYCKSLLQELGSKASVVAKIERVEATVNADDIISESDAIMVARGDLAIEVGASEVPGIQKKLTKIAKSLSKPVIVATQMMESMIDNSVPTRAEVSDVANAVLDGTDAVMLSAETAVGSYPETVIATVSKVCKSAEKYNVEFRDNRNYPNCNHIEEQVAISAIQLANNVNAKAIVALTESGRTSLWMSRVRSGIPIYGLSRNLQSIRKMKLYRDVFPFYFDVTNSPYGLVNFNTVSFLEGLGFLAKGDYIVLTKGDYMGMEEGINAVKVLEVGNVRKVV